MRTSPLPRPETSSCPYPAYQRNDPVLFVRQCLSNPFSGPPRAPSGFHHPSLSLSLSDRTYRYVESTTPPTLARTAVCVSYVSSAARSDKKVRRVGNGVVERPRFSLSPSFKGEWGNVAGEGTSRIYWTCLGEESRLVVLATRPVLHQKAN